MPRIYYNQEDFDVQIALFVAHAIGYMIGTVAIWVLNMPYAGISIFLWTMLLAYHSYWRTSLTDGTQFRTYTRLRNRFGQDWDLAASPEEFDLERKNATLEVKLKHIVPDSVRVLIPAAITLLLIGRISESIPTNLISTMFMAWLTMLVFLQVLIRREIHQNSRDYQHLKQKQAENLNHTISASRLQAKAGNTFVIGDDGELVEVPQQRHYRDTG